MSKPRWKHLGICHADTAMLLIGDPCYSVYESHPEHPIHQWEAFCGMLDAIDKIGARALQLNHPRGHAGMGVVVRTGYDGEFEVEGLFSAAGDMIEIRIRPTG